MGYEQSRCEKKKKNFELSILNNITYTTVRFSFCTLSYGQAEDRLTWPEHVAQRGF